MGLETGDLISGLNETWPTGGDNRSEGDDHFRLLKHVLKYTFSDTATSFTITKGGSTYSFNNAGVITVNGLPLTGGATIGDSPPGTPSIGQFWWESDTGKLYVYYNDGTSSQWVPAHSGAGPKGDTGVGVSGGSVTIGTTAPSSPSVNDVWIDTN